MTIVRIVRSQVLPCGAGAKGTRGQKASTRVADLVLSLALALALAIGAASPALALDAPATGWSRLWGQGALDTMQHVVGCGDASEYGNAFADGRGGTVVVATMGGFWDALTASGLAGIEDAPLLMTDGTSLSSQTASELDRLSPDRVLVCGGEAAVSRGVEDRIRELTGADVTRLAGAGAVETSLEVHAASDAWSKTAFVATVTSFQDALSIAPYAYAEHCPIFLSGWDGRLSGATLDAIRAGGFDSVYVVGGQAVVSAEVEGQLGSLFAGRLWGNGAVETSRAIAQWELGHGMSADGVGVATVSSYYDALCGAALCGHDGSVLVLVSDANRACVDDVIAPNSADVSTGYVFGGTAAVSGATADALAAATANPFPGVDEGHASSVTYAEGVVGIPDAGWEASTDGSSVTLPASEVPEGVAAGTTVALTGTGSAGEGGKALAVTSVSRDGDSVTLTGATPDVSAVVDDVDVEGVTSDVSGFVPAEGVTVEGASSAAGLSPQDAGDEESLGKIKLALDLDGKGKVKLTIEPTVEYSIHGSGKDMSVYVGARMETTVDCTATGAKYERSKLLGIYTCPTEVPGLSVSVTLWAVFSAKGEVSLEWSSVTASGVQYAGGRWRTPTRSDIRFDGAKASVELRGGIDLDFSADFCCQPIVDAALGGGVKASGEEYLRPSAMLCVELKAGPYFEFTIGEHSLMKKFGITYEKQFLDDCMPLHAHFEDGATVPGCTWHNESVEGAEVGGLPASLDYTGEPVRPSGLTVVVGGRQLVEGTDYRLSYEDNVEPGTATVTIRGIGSYKGVARRTFEIRRDGGEPSSTVWGTLYSTTDPGAADPSPTTAEYLAITGDGRTLATATIDGKERALAKVGDSVDMSNGLKYYGLVENGGWWASIGKDVTRAQIVDKVRPYSTESYFFCLNSLKTVDGMENLDTSNSTSTAGMWSCCYELESIDLSHMDTSKVTNMKDMFVGCIKLKDLDVSSFITSNVTNMECMFGDDLFGGCRALTSLDVSHFDTSKVTNMFEMFEGCSGLLSLDLRSFSCTNVTTMVGMFGNCSTLTSLDISSFETIKVTSMAYMFDGCESLATILYGHSFVNSSFDYSGALKPTDGMFDACPANKPSWWTGS